MKTKVKVRWRWRWRWRTTVKRVTYKICVTLLFVPFLVTCLWPSFPLALSATFFYCHHTYKYIYTVCVCCVLFSLFTTNASRTHITSDSFHLRLLHFFFSFCCFWFWLVLLFAVSLLNFVYFISSFIDKWTDPHAHTYAIYMLRMGFWRLIIALLCIWFLCEFLSLFRSFIAVVDFVFFFTLCYFVVSFSSVLPLFFVYSVRSSVSSTVVLYVLWFSFCVSVSLASNAECGLYFWCHNVNRSTKCVYYTHI